MRDFLQQMLLTLICLNAKFTNISDGRVTDICKMAGLSICTAELGFPEDFSSLEVFYIAHANGFLAMSVS